ncbi:MAG: radical SAM protein [Thermodesulfobacteriota bacterium]
MSLKVLMVSPVFRYSFLSLPEYRAMMGGSAMFPPLGLLTVAALLPREWEVRLADLNVRPLSGPDWAWADVVMVSGMYAQRDGFLEVIREARRRGKVSVAGGPYPTAHPEDVASAGCNFVVRGEGEVTVPQLIEALEEGSPGALIEARGRPDLSLSPIPRYDLLRIDDYVNTAVQTSRGCPHACEFCDVTALFGRAPRYKRPEQVVAELEQLYRLRAPSHAFICDDNLIADRSHARAILEAIIDWNRERGEPFGFSTQCTVELGRDPEMIDLLTAANFGTILIGVESPDEEALVRARKTQNVRRPLADLIDTICRNGLTVLPSFIVGLDGEKRGVGRRICELVEKTAAPIATINILHAPPRTKLWERMEKEGRLLRDSLPGDEIFGLPNYIPDRPLEQVLSEFTGTWDYLYEPRRFLARAYRYYLRMRPTRRALAESRGERFAGPRQRRRLSRRGLLDLRVLWTIVWRQGILAPYRRQFWNQLLGMMRRNPSRLPLYLHRCVHAEDMFRIRRTLLSLQRERRPAPTQTPPDHVSTAMRRLHRSA